MVCQEIWSFDDEEGVVKLEGLQALCPEVHLAKHVLVQADDKQRQTAMWTLQAMNECVTSRCTQVELWCQIYPGACDFA